MTVATKTSSKPWLFIAGQAAWNKGTGGCKRGHDAEHWTILPSGLAVCLKCKRENAAKYRLENRERIRFKNRLSRYSMLVSEFEALWEKQRGACSICGMLFEDDNYRIDHDHETGRVRGLLCASCNTAMGLFKDAPAVLLNAVRYLVQNGD